MLTHIHPKLPMRNKSVTRNFYLNKLLFEDISATDYPNYLIVKKDAIEIHFFEHKTLHPDENDAQVYIRTTQIGNLYQTMLDSQVKIHPNGFLETKSWGQKEFSILDPDKNLLTFGESL